QAVSLKLRIIWTMAATIGLALGASRISSAVPIEASKKFGFGPRIETKPYLSMPLRADGALPPLLSQTGAFADTKNFSLAEGLIPYDLIVPFWSDGAVKSRYVSVPQEKIKFAATGEWVFPAGTVFVKTFELPVDETNPNLKRRLETRLLVRDD